MLAVELAAIKARCEAATPGPWRGDCFLYDSEGNDLLFGNGAGIGVFCEDADAQFAAHAREDMPRLVAEVERLQAVLAVREERTAGMPPVKVSVETGAT